MTMRYFVSIISILISSTAFGSSLVNMPDPKNYPATDSFHGTPKNPIISSKLAKSFRTKIREGAMQGPNFAGHYTIITWGCGMDAYMFVVVDAKTGKIYEPPVGCIASAGGYGMSFPGYPKINNPGYQIDSKLINIVGIEDPMHSDGSDRAATVYMFDNGKFKKIYREPALLK